MYKILHEFSFDINIYETCLGNVIKRASGKLYNVSGTSLYLNDNKHKILFITRLRRSWTPSWTHSPRVSRMSRLRLY